MTGSELIIIWIKTPTASMFLSSRCRKKVTFLSKSAIPMSKGRLVATVSSSPEYVHLQVPRLEDDTRAQARRRHKPSRTQVRAYKLHLFTFEISKRKEAPGNHCLCHLRAYRNPSSLESSRSPNVLAIQVSVASTKDIGTRYWERKSFGLSEVPLCATTMLFHVVRLARN